MTDKARELHHRIIRASVHKTRAEFDRYHIVSPADLQDVARRLAGSDGHNSVGFRSLGLTCVL